MARASEKGLTVPEEQGVAAVNAETRREAELFTVRQAEGHQIPLPGPCRIRPPIGSSHAPCPERERRPVRALRVHGLSPIPFSIVHKSRVFSALSSEKSVWKCRPSKTLPSQASCSIIELSGDDGNSHCERLQRGMSQMRVSLASDNHVSRCVRLFDI